MKYIHTYLFLFLMIFHLSAQTDFDTHFKEDKLRFDYKVIGSKDEMKIQKDNFYLDRNWGGSRINTIDTMLYGELLLEVFDSASNKLIYSRGYSSLFKEWQNTEEADTVERTFIESVILPFPRNAIKIAISVRDENLEFETLYTINFNPDFTSLKEKILPEFVKFREISKKGDACSKVDLVFLSAGYPVSDSIKFFTDVTSIADKLVQWDPYTNYSEAFNVYAAFASDEFVPLVLHEDSLLGDIPVKVIFNTFGSERYLTTEHIAGVRDMVSGISYDQICVIANTEKYGGGGIYNYLTLFSSDNEHTEFLFHHEFGHGFVSLADEYYSSLVPYSNYFSLDQEPYEPNITTRVDFGAKWESMICDTVPLPTPNLQTYVGVVGLFEGGGYIAKGVFRPSYDCSMKSKMDNAFCPVCKKAIEQMILFYAAE